MATVNIPAAFSYKWAENGTTEAIDDAQYKVGWAFIGATPPSVEQFNKVHQIADEKSNWLYQQMLAVVSSTVIGVARNVKMTVSAASASGTLTADEVVLKTALGGSPYGLSAVNKTINLGTVGAGGMDVGLAPVSGYVAIYLIYNPTSSASALLAVNATSAVAPQVYGGASMPAGYTASALVSVWPTNASRLLIVGSQTDRTVSVPAVGVLSSAVVTAAPTALSISSAVPPNARRIAGTCAIESSASSNISLSIYATAQATGLQGLNLITSSPFGGSVFQVSLGGPIQTTYYDARNTAGTPKFTIAISVYEF